jgi:hypothetical protein
MITQKLQAAKQGERLPFGVNDPTPIAASVQVRRDPSVRVKPLALALDPATITQEQS